MPRGNKKGAVYKKEPELDSKIGQYYVARKQGKNKTQAQLVAGFADTMHASRIEKTKTYELLEQKFYKDELLGKISLAELADEHVKNILQDEDRGAKNKAIEMMMKKVEPDDVPNEVEVVKLVLKG